MNKLINRIMPFILIGIAIVAFAFGILILAYLFLIGAIIGLSLFLISWVRDKLYPPKTVTKVQKKPQGRTFDSDDWKEL